MSQQNPKMKEKLTKIIHNNIELNNSQKLTYSKIRICKESILKYVLTAKKTKSKK